ncbi:MAG: ATP-dependent DNA helicase [Clostridia bacterium]|nr:ATP-dependent DNA helicase [Clostridia bacterium]
MASLYDTHTNTVYISTRELCAFVFRGGNIDTHFTPGNKNGGGTVSYKLHTEKPNISDAYTLNSIQYGATIQLYTFPESIRYKDGGYYVEDVYNVPYRLDSLEAGELEIATKCAMLSAYIISEKYKQSTVDVIVTFYSESGDEEREYSSTFTKEDLELFFESVMEQYAPFAILIKERGTKTISQLSNLRFPFKGGAREGQRDFIVEAFRSIRAHKRLVVEAPTGTGKTMASLYPALKSLGEGYGDKIFYFTGKGTTALAALNAIDLMRDQIPNLRAIHISSKDKCCVSFGPGTRRKCDPKNCKVAVSYYDKVNSAMYELLTEYKTYTKDIIDKVSKKYSICPYELSLELSEWCELVVCDYNYLFDLQAYFRRYFECPTGAEYIFLIDESHNLPDRAREMYSMSLNRSDFIKIAERYGGNKQIGDPCVDILGKFEEFYALAMSEKMELDGKICGFYINNELPFDIGEHFYAFVGGCKKLFKRDIEDEELYQLYMDTKKFLAVSEIFDKRFTMYIEAVDEEVKIRLMCLDPSFMLDLCMKKGISTILFSATLTPLEYFSDVLGCPKTSTLTLKSPFDKENLCLIGVNNVSTRYEDRQKSALTVANIIRATIEGRVGNYIVYFPSYSYLTDVKDVFVKKYPKINVTCQSRSMSERAKREFLDSFDSKREGTLVGFCVMGGSFSEGIDLRGERLIGAIIVGVGLPTISSELNIIKEYFDKTRETGYAYAYTYPGMIKVLQAAGRVIRSEDEKGVVLLVDDRFYTPEYRQLMPEYWSHIKFISSAKDLLGEITNFWKK